MRTERRESIVVASEGGVSWVEGAVGAMCARQQNSDHLSRARFSGVSQWHRYQSRYCLATAAAFYRLGLRVTKEEFTTNTMSRGSDCLLVIKSAGDVRVFVVLRSMEYAPVGWGVWGGRWIGFVIVNMRVGVGRRELVGKEMGGSRMLSTHEW